MAITVILTMIFIHGIRKYVICCRLYTLNWTSQWILNICFVSYLKITCFMPTWMLIICLAPWCRSTNCKSGVRDWRTCVWLGTRPANKVAPTTSSKTDITRWALVVLTSVKLWMAFCRLFFFFIPSLSRNLVSPITLQQFVYVNL